MYKGIMFGDSIGHGSLGEGRLNPTPMQIINNAQTSFNFVADYTKGGASFKGIFSEDASVRQANGMPNGKTVDQVMKDHPDCTAVLVCMVANDACVTTQQREEFVGYVDEMVNTATANGKVCCFIGNVDLNVKMSMYNTGSTNYRADYPGYFDALHGIAVTMMTLKQWCYLNDYIFFDMSKATHDFPIDQITGDIVHPTQAYANTVFTRFGNAIQG